MYEVLNVLQPTLSRSFERAMAMPVPELVLRRPLTIIRTDVGMAAYLGNDPARGIEWSNDNGNTTPVVGATLARRAGEVPARQRRHPPAPEVRARCKVVEVDGKLIYDSDVNGHQELTIPGVELSRTKRSMSGREWPEGGAPALTN